MLNLFLGFQALLYIIGSRRNLKTAIYYLTASVIMDGFDGTIARLTKTESNFGVQLDSLVDAEVLASGERAAAMLADLQE